MEPRNVVQAAIDAYHAHDLDRCLSFYAPDVVVKRVDGEILMDGAEAVRARYAKSISDHPNLHYDIPNRIALGDYVIDEERVTGYSAGGPDVVRAVLVYRFDGDLIREILILSRAATYCASRQPIGRVSNLSCRRASPDHTRLARAGASFSRIEVMAVGGTSA